MSYGEPERGGQPWSLPEDEARPFFARALELGINFFDTANVYSAGSSEEITGRALRDFANRDEIVVATKVHGRMRDGPNGAGLSRKAILAEIDASLRRLGTDYVDLYQIHRWDPATPIEETLEALHDVVKAGKARYIGASSMWAWQFAKALHVADTHGWTRFVSMQDHYNLLYREEEREMLPLCVDEGVGVIPWSPLARGRLTRAVGRGHRTGRDSTSSASRSTSSRTATGRSSTRVGEVAETRGVPRAQVALAWLLSQPGVTAPIVGATKLEHLDDAVRRGRPAAERRRGRPARGAVHPAPGRRSLTGRACRRTARSVAPWRTAADRDADGVWLRSPDGELTFGAAASVVAATAQRLADAGVRPRGPRAADRAQHAAVPGGLAGGRVARGDQRADQPGRCRRPSCPGCWVRSSRMPWSRTPSCSARRDWCCRPPRASCRSTTSPRAGPTPALRPQPDARGPADVAEGDVAVLLPTSGTTGRSKLVMQTHRAYAMAGRGLPVLDGAGPRRPADDLAAAVPRQRARVLGRWAR